MTDCGNDPEIVNFEDSLSRELSWDLFSMCAIASSVLGLSYALAFCDMHMNVISIIYNLLLLLFLLFLHHLSWRKDHLKVVKSVQHLSLWTIYLPEKLWAKMNNSSVPRLFVEYQPYRWSINTWAFCMYILFKYATMCRLPPMVEEVRIDEWSRKGHMHP